MILEQIPKIPLGQWVDVLIDWAQTNLSWLFAIIKLISDAIIIFVQNFLMWFPPEVLIIIIVALALFAGQRRLALGIGVGMFLLLNLGLWNLSIVTLTLTLAATAVVLLFGIPIGIFAALNEQVNRIVTPVLDFMQTMPPFVYLVPAVILFSDIGRVPAMIAIVIFAMPPVIRLTNLGIRQVPTELVEAARAFGSTSMQTLRKVQMPVAKPTIMAGVNQCIMLALSMAVIAAMIGAGGLGGTVLRGLQRLDVPTAFEGGLGIVIIAMILDRLTQVVGSYQRKKA